VEQRLKLKYGQTIPQLSSQMLVDCNYMNEGCKGGYSLFNGYFAESGYLVEEACAPYKDGHAPCSAHAACAPHSKIARSYFLGRGYGDYGEKRMMKELLRNGLINAEYERSSYSSTYHSGVISQKGI